MTEHDRITAFATTRTAAEWARMPVCRVSLELLLRRLTIGFVPEKAITADVLPGDSGEPQEVEYQRGVPEMLRRRKRHSKYIGVTRNAGSWKAQIKIGRGKVLSIGTFPSELEAAQAYDEEARPRGRKVNFHRGNA